MAEAKKTNEVYDPISVDKVDIELDAREGLKVYYGPKIIGTRCRTQLSVKDPIIS